MIKTIHCIKVGPRKEFGDFEKYCINTWKKTYPDFEIRYWYDDEILPMLSDCLFAVNAYNSGKYAFAMDYVKLKILSQNGGMYLDTDVYCVKRVPDSYFEKSFTSWDAGFSTYWVQNGNCMYCNELHNKYVDEGIKLYQSYKDDKVKENMPDNTCFDFVIRPEEKKERNLLTIRKTDLELEHMNILNAEQFACYDYILNKILPTDKSRYFVHARSQSWMNYKSENVGLYYAILDKNTDLDKLSKAFDNFLRMDFSNSKLKHVFVLVLNDLNSTLEADIANKFMVSQNRTNKLFTVFPVGDGLSFNKCLDCLTDYITKKYNKIKYTRNILVGDFDGGLHV